MKPRNVIIAGLIVGALLWALSARAQQPTVQWQAVQQAITNIQSQLNSLQTQITKINNSGIASTPAHDLLITEGGSFTLFNMPLDTFLLGNGASVDPSALAVPNCTDATGNHLNYSTNTHTLSCGTSSSGGSNITAGAGDFNACTQTGASLNCTVSASHLAAALPIAQGGTGTTAGAVVTITSQVFTGNGTYTPHAGLLYAFVRLVGGGGAGGGVNGSAAGQDAGASGGCSGGYSEGIVTAAQITTDGGTETITVGAGGTPGSAGNNPGGNGGDTSFGSRVIGKAGGGGSGMLGSSNASTACTVAVAGTGTFTPVGNAGGIGISAGITTVNLISGFGAPSVFGGGATGVNGNTAACFAGVAGGNYGAGGSGGLCIATTNTIAGGAGKAGVVLVTEYNNQ